MSVPLDQSSIPAPVAPPKDQTGAETTVESPKADVQHVENTDKKDAAALDANGNPVDWQNNIGMAVIEQRQVIPTSGKRMPTGKWEYISFCVFYFSNNGAPIGGNGGALRQALLNQAFPDGRMSWGGRWLPVNSVLLDITGIMFAAQLFCLLTIGPYADYGNWRPWIMIFFQVILYACQFGMCGVSKPSQWQAAQALFVLGNLATNLVTSFYAATFPGIARDLPKLIKSEQDVVAGLKSPEEHAELDAYERSKLYNLCNITGSGLVALFYAIAVGISAGVGFDTDVKLIHSYNVLMGYFGALTVLCTVPFFILQKHRPGQQLPEGTKWWLAGPQQVWSALKGAKQLKQCMLYLVAYFMLQETFGTYFNVTGLLQNEVIHYSPLKLNAMSLVSDLAGGSGTLFMLLLQKKFRFSVKAGVFYGACMTLPPSLWGAIGTHQKAIGFHHAWEFWLACAWNFQTAAWGSYNVTMISEVVPAPKAFMFFALFNCVGKTSGFIGPFISSAIINRANGNNNTAYWFLFGMGLLGVFILYFVDTDKAKIDNARFLEREAERLYSQEQRQQQAEKLNEEEVESDPIAEKISTA